MNLKDIIINALNNSEQIDIAINELSQSQENLLQNYTNPVFNQTDKKNILAKYNYTEELIKSLQRFNKLKNSNYFTDAEEQKADIQNKILKGGISYNHYIWHSENSKHTCDICKSLDGKEFDFYDEVPERPHPNCKCYVEIVEDSEENSGLQNPPGNEEPCDNIEQIEIMINKIEEAIQESQSLYDNINSEIKYLENDIKRTENLIQATNLILDTFNEEYGKHLPECGNNIDKDYEYMYAKKEELQTFLHNVMGVLFGAWALADVVYIFVSNYIELLYHAYRLKEFEMDKYYHSKANCEATQEMGIVGERYAALLSDLKEKYDQYTYVHTHRVTLEEALADSERDQVANRLGRKRGKQYSYCKCSILMHDLLPNYKK